MQFIRENGSKLRAYVIRESVENHCKQIENLGERGTQAEIFAVATLLKIQIFIFTCQPKAFVGRCQCLWNARFGHIVRTLYSTYKCTVQYFKVRYIFVSTIITK